mgnify:FL=1|jgi:outer membrane receptor protein involved in Fe transport
MIPPPMDLFWHPHFSAGQLGSTVVGQRTATRSQLRAALGCSLLVLMVAANPAQTQESEKGKATPTKPTAATAPARTNAAGDSLSQEMRWLKAEKVVVTSVSKREEDPFTTAAAVSVITGEEIRRAGARSIAAHPRTLRKNGR